jgi:hypothetical protein
MSAVQIIRGTAALPPDIEDQFRQAFGREMNEEERAFFGLQVKNVENRYAAQQDWIAKVA